MSDLPRVERIDDGDALFIHECKNVSFLTGYWLGGEHTYWRSC